MSSIRYALLSLLAREPLSGYDIKLQMNNRLNPFWKAGSNQVYPELSKMETEGLITLHGVEQNTYRPARKLYEITDEGLEELKQWMLKPVVTSDNLRDEFILTVYDSWLVEPEKMNQKIEFVRKHHEEKLAAYLDKLEELKEMKVPEEGPNPVDPSISVVEFGIQYERLYIEWCESLMKKL